MRMVAGEAGWMSGPMDSVVSKWCYRLDVTRKEGQRVHVGLHQEDERVRQVGQRRPFLDIGIVVLRQAEDGSFELIDHVKFETERQVELEIKLPRGSFIILPLTSGALLRKNLAKFKDYGPYLTKNTPHGVEASS